MANVPETAPLRLRTHERTSLHLGCNYAVVIGGAPSLYPHSNVHQGASIACFFTLKNSIPMVRRYLCQILNRPFWAAIMPILQAETGTFAMQKGHSCKSVDATGQTLYVARRGVKSVAIELHVQYLIVAACYAGVAALVVLVAVVAPDKPQSAVGCHLYLVYIA